MVIKNSVNGAPDFQNREFFTVYNSCPICHSNHITSVLVSHDNHYNVQGEYKHFRCENCSSLFLNPMPTERFLSNAYPSDYYAYQEHGRESSIKTILKKLLFLEYKTDDPRFSKPGVMLDIGCGSGEFLAKMHEKGWKTFGVEPSEIAARTGNRHPGLNIHNGTLLSTNFPDKYFDFIRSNHSLEHIPNPHQNLQEIARIIKPGGKLFFGVPNTDGYAFKLFKQYWWNLGAPQHPINYNESSLRALVVPYGFKVISTKTNSPYAGLLGSYQIKINNKRDKKTDKGAFLDFVPLKVLSGVSTRILDLLKKGDCLEMTFEKT